MAARDRLQRLLWDLEAGSGVADPPQRETPGDGDGREADAAVHLDTSGTASDAASSRSADAVPRQGTFARAPAAAKPALTREVLQQRVLALLRERKEIAAAHACELSQRDAEAAALRARLDGELAQLAARQRDVEARAPLVSAQLAEARAALTEGLLISDDRAAELRAAPFDRLGLADAVRLAVHDGLRNLRSENERLRLGAETAREGMARLEAESARLRRDNARLAAEAAERSAEADAAVAALEGRAARLASELEEAALAADVLRAKGRRYDEAEARVQQAEAEVVRLAGFESSAAQLKEALKASEAECRELQGQAALREAECELTAREVARLAGAVSRLEGEVQAKDGKIAELKVTRSELHRQLAEAQAAGRGNPRELARLAAASAADIEAARRSASEAAARELREMRDARDAAQESAASSRAELRELAAAHEELQRAMHARSAAADVRVAELAADLRVAANGLAQAQALCEERGAELREARERVQQLDTRTRALEVATAAQASDAERTAAELRAQLDAAVTQLAAYEAAELALTTGRGAGAGAGGGAGALPAGGAFGGRGGAAGALRPLRALGLSAMSARGAELEKERAELLRARHEAAARAQRAEAELGAARSQLALVGQPQRVVLEALAAAQARVEEAEARAEAVQKELDSRKAAAAAGAVERAALRADLQRLLRERGALDSLRTLVSGTLARRRQRVPGGGGGEAV